MQFEQQKKTDLKKRLLRKLNELNEQINRLPAASRRKKDKKNRAVFSSVLIIVALVGIIVFGIGWLAVALLGTVLSVAIIETGLFLSLGMGFGANLLHQVYTGIRDLFASEKIKIQNKVYDNLQKDCLELQALCVEKVILSKKIKTTLNLAKHLEIAQLDVKDLKSAQFDLNDTLKNLKAKQKKHPVYARRQKDQKNWARIFRYSEMTSLIEIGIYMCALTLGVLFPGSLFLVPVVLSSFAVLTSIAVSIFIGPIAVSSLLYAGYLFIRNALSSEHKEYNKLEKIIRKLEKLSQQQDRLDQLIKGKVQDGVNDFEPAEVTYDKNVSAEQASTEKASKPIYGLSFFKTVSATDEVIPAMTMRIN